MKTELNWLLAAILAIFASVGPVAGFARAQDVVVDQPEETASPQGITSSAKQRRAVAERLVSSASSDAILSSRYRSYDGSGNNKADPQMGSSFSHLLRLMPADYADGVDAMAGHHRPSARAVSNAISAQREDEDIPNAYGGTDFVWQWGQFIDHDLGLTDGLTESAPIPVPLGDPDFDPHAQGDVTIPFARALYDPLTGTDENNPREQENEISAYIDGSMVYGSDSERAAALREPGTPYLKVSAGNLMPFNTEGLPNANGPVSDPTSLFLAGDVRANEQVGLAAMHTLFVREHNRLAADLWEGQPYFSSEDAFQQARRLVIAKIQIITYEEFLPALLGKDTFGPYEKYRRRMKIGIYNEFSGAAFRLGHSMLNTHLLRLDDAGREIPSGHLGLRDAFFTAPQVLREEGDLDPLFRGMASQPHQAIDTKIIPDVRNFLFGRPGSGGLDLAALNIQRGRDHGLPSYNDVRNAMKSRRASRFAQITSDPERQATLAALYDHPDDVDLWVGGLAEDVSKDGGQLGPTFRKILLRQFGELRKADRFWWENDLSPAEQEQVRGTTLANVIRANTGISDEIQDNVFKLP